MKKILSIALIALLVIGCLASCTKADKAAEETTTDVTTAKIADFDVLPPEGWGETTATETTTVTEETTEDESEYAPVLVDWKIWWTDEYAEEIEEDITLLSRFLYGECRGKNVEFTDKIAVGTVILNYAGKSEPGHLAELIKTTRKGYQYSNYITSYDGYDWNKPADEPEAWDICTSLAYDLYWSWLKEIDHGDTSWRVISKDYKHFWSENGEIYFPLDWATRKSHSTDFLPGT